MPLAVALQSQEPRGSAALVHFQKQPFTVLISARIRQSCLDCNRCKLAHRVTPTFSHHTLGRQSVGVRRSEEHTPELQSLIRISYAVFCLKNKIQHQHKSDTGWKLTN